MILAAQLSLVIGTWLLALACRRRICRWLGWDYGLVATLALGVSGPLIALVWAA